MKRQRVISRLHTSLLNCSHWPADIAGLIAGYAERSTEEKLESVIDHGWQGMQYFNSRHVRIGLFAYGQRGMVWVSLGDGKRCDHYDTKESLARSVAARWWFRALPEKRMTDEEVAAIEQWLSELE